MYKRIMVSLAVVMLGWAWQGQAADKPPAASVQRAQLDKRLKECSPNTQLNKQGLPDMDCGKLDILIRNDKHSIMLMEQLLRQTTRPEIKSLIQQVITDRKQELERLNIVRQRLYGALPE